MVDSVDVSRIGDCASTIGNWRCMLTSGRWLCAAYTENVWGLDVVCPTHSRRRIFTPRAIVGQQTLGSRAMTHASLLRAARRPRTAFIVRRLLVNGIVRRVLAVAAIGALAAGCDRATSIPITRERALMDSLFAQFTTAGMPGASLLVVRHDTVLVNASFGLSDVESKTPASAATNYRLASLTKQFTATAIVLLVQDGALSLDTRARSILPELPAYASQVTIRHLLTHTSGLWDYEAFVPDSQTRQVTDRDALDLVSAKAESLYFAPGANWRYSNKIGRASCRERVCLAV